MNTANRFLGNMGLSSLFMVTPPTLPPLMEIRCSKYSQRPDTRELEHIQYLTSRNELLETASEQQDERCVSRGDGGEVRR